MQWVSHVCGWAHSHAFPPPVDLPLPPLPKRSYRDACCAFHPQYLLPRMPRPLQPDALNLSIGSPAGSTTSDLLISRIASYGLPATAEEHCPAGASDVVDFSDIHFCRNPDGSLVQLGSGAFSTVSVHNCLLCVCCVDRVALPSLSSGPGISSCSVQCGSEGRRQAADCRPYASPAPSHMHVHA